MIIICSGILFGCGNQTANYPGITVTINETKVPYYTIPIKWHGNTANRPNTYIYVFEQNPEMENLVEANSGDNVTVDFKSKNPDTVKINCELLTVPYYPGIENTSSAVETFTMGVTMKNNKYNFKINEFDIEKFDHKYYWLFTPRHPQSVLNPDNLCYIAGRVYTIIASWGGDVCEYAFVIKNKDDIGKGDVTLADKTQNLNVMLIRPDNWDKIVDSPVISEKEMGIIDGSTATIPITAELYRQFFDYSDKKLDEYQIAYSHSMTHNAYMNLIERKNRFSTAPVSIIFVTSPSEEEMQLAEKAGVELDITPIAKDGFVFITHKSNPVDNLTVEQIQAIYTGEITNWKEVGGEDIEIQAYQREANSGSQTAMEQMVMQGKKMMKAKEAHVIGGMGELIESVAEYENGKASIGYTYYYYINNLYKNENIKVLKINGITPDNENLINESYPFSTNYYAVIRGDEKADSPARKLRDFFITEQGQQLIEMAGYCKSVH